MKTKLTIAALVAMSVAGAQAAVITWDAGASSTTAPTAITDVSNIGADAPNLTYTWDFWDGSTRNTLAPSGAFNLGLGGTVNGVDFFGYGGNGDFWTGLGGASTGDATFDGIIGYHDGAGGPGNSWELNVAGLVGGQEYQVQIFGIHDLRTEGDIPTRATYFQDQDGGAASATLVRPTGGWVTGTFTTGAAETTFSIDGWSASGNDPGASAVAIRAIPEPATLGLISIFGGAVLFLRRLRIIG